MRITPTAAFNPQIAGCGAHLATFASFRWLGYGFAMNTAGLRIKPLTPVLGAEVEGIDLERQGADELRARGTPK